jgi:hypothetical protein
MLFVGHNPRWYNTLKVQELGLLGVVHREKHMCRPQPQWARECFWRRCATVQECSDVEREVLQARCNLIVLPPLSLPEKALGLPGQVQLKNAAIAVALCREVDGFLTRSPPVVVNSEEVPVESTPCCGLKDLQADIHDKSSHPKDTRGLPPHDRLDPLQRKGLQQLAPSTSPLDDSTVASSLKKSPGGLAAREATPRVLDYPSETRFNRAGTGANLGNAKGSSQAAPCRDATFNRLAQAGTAHDCAGVTGGDKESDRRWREWVVPGAVRLQAAGRVAELAAGRLPAAYAAGLKSCEFPGRAQLVIVPAADLLKDAEVDAGASAPSTSQTEVSFFLDGAHTPASMLSCAQWFSEASAAAAAGEGPEAVDHMLLFNCMTSRQPLQLLTPLARLPDLQHACFVPQQSQYSSVTPVEGPRKDVSWQKGSAEVWEGLKGQHGAKHSHAQAMEALRSSLGMLVGCTPVLAPTGWVQEWCYIFQNPFTLMSHGNVAGHAETLSWYMDIDIY